MLYFVQEPSKPTFWDSSQSLGIIDKLFTNTTNAFIRLTFADSRDDLITTPAERVVYSDTTVHLYERGGQVMYGRAA